MAFRTGQTTLLLFQTQSSGSFVVVDVDTGAAYQVSSGEAYTLATSSMSEICLVRMATEPAPFPSRDTHPYGGPLIYHLLLVAVGLNALDPRRQC
jgi:hypothetical protein